MAWLCAAPFGLLRDGGHGLMEGAVEHLDEEVDGVAAKIKIKPEASEGLQAWVTEETDCRRLTTANHRVREARIRSEIASSTL